jgi:hypothetical protein
MHHPGQMNFPTSSSRWPSRTGRYKHPVVLKPARIFTYYQPCLNRRILYLVEETNPECNLTRTSLRRQVTLTRLQPRRIVGKRGGEVRVGLLRVGGELFHGLQADLEMDLEACPLACWSSAMLLTPYYAIVYHRAHRQKQLLEP